MGGDSSNGDIARRDLAPGLGSNKWETGYQNDGTIDMHHLVAWLMNSFIHSVYIIILIILIVTIILIIIFIIILLLI